MVQKLTKVQEKETQNPEAYQNCLEEGKHGAGSRAKKKQSCFNQ
jgi:hypothetical protein